MPDMQWHEHCLKCTECSCSLLSDASSATCFIKNGKPYCKTDYRHLFSTKCDRCMVFLNKEDLVIRSKSKIFHFDCFSCSICNRKLLPGDEYQLKNDMLFCKEDSMNQNSNNTSAQLYLSSNFLAQQTSSVGLTPENSIKSSPSPSQILLNDDPNYSTSNSSSCSSSIVDSPSNNNSNIMNNNNQNFFFASSNSSPLFNQSNGGPGFTFNNTNTSSSYFNMDMNSANKNGKAKFFDYDSQDKDGKLNVFLLIYSKYSQLCFCFKNSV